MSRMTGCLILSPSIPWVAACKMASTNSRFSPVEQRLWIGSLGRPASFGCIILGIPAAEMLYNLAEVGVVVVIE